MTKERNRRKHFLKIHSERDLHMNNEGGPTHGGHNTERWYSKGTKEESVQILTHMCTHVIISFHNRRMRMRNSRKMIFRPVAKII